MANTDAAFVSSVPELHTRYMGAMFFEPYVADLASRLRDMSSGRLLETACGAGVVTARSCRWLRAPVAMTATDLNEPMLDAVVAAVGLSQSPVCKAVQGPRRLVSG
jgi:hypothetical protein